MLRGSFILASVIVFVILLQSKAEGACATRGEVILEGDPIRERQYVREQRVTEGCWHNNAGHRDGRCGGKHKFDYWYFGRCYCC